MPPFHRVCRMEVSLQSNLLDTTIHQTKYRSSWLAISDQNTFHTHSKVTPPMLPYLLLYISLFNFFTFSMKIILKNLVTNSEQDSREQMLQLFDVLNKNQNQNLTIPMKMRNLPESFFRPPQIGSKSPGVHSRENSLDNGPFSPGPPVGSPGPPPGHHTRTSSCPATLGPIDGRSGPQHQVDSIFSLCWNFLGTLRKNWLWMDSRHTEKMDQPFFSL